MRRHLSTRDTLPGRVRVRRDRRPPVAFCMGMALALVTLAVPLAGSVGTALAGPEKLTAYQNLQLERGAVTIPVAAEAEYRAGLEAMANGRLETAQTHLESAIALAPRYSDAHFTLARLCARRLNPDAVYYFVSGFAVMVQSFDGQRMLAVNAVLITTLVLLIASGIAWVALAMRYFPFIAHRLQETLRTRFNAAAPRLAAYLLLLAPFALLPGYAAAAGLVLMLTWPFMQKRERMMSFVIAGAFAALAWFTPTLDRFSTVADPASMVSLVARANESAADPTLTRAIASAPAQNLEAEQQTALGIMAMRSGETETAAAHFLRAISYRPEASIAYVNLGNVYYLNRQYDKALEGYRKAEQTDSTDAVAHYNLAQAYIKTLLMSESSHALARASQIGIEAVTVSYAAAARARMEVYPRLYTNGDLWRVARVEGATHNPALLAHALAAATGHSPLVNFWITVGALVCALVSARVIKRHRLSFQCANCGDITCDGCCNDERGSVLCQACATSVVGVTSDRVLEALLRQRRQSVIVRRRKSIRWLTAWIPGVRHIYYGRFVGGFVVAAFFSLCAVVLWMQGFPFPRWDSTPMSTPLWQWILPALGIVWSYLVSVTSRQLFEVRHTRTAGGRQRATEGADDDLNSQTA